MISLIAAMTKDRVIGKGLQLPWNLPEDLQHFKKTTLGKPIIMGRKTFDSIKRKPLPGRDNIIISRSLPVTADYKVVATIEEALAVAGNVAEIMVIGGASIYQEFLPLAQRMYITLVHHDYEGDVFFPEYDAKKWKLITEDIRDEFTIQVLDRI